MLHRTLLLDRCPCARSAVGLSGARHLRKEPLIDLDSSNIYPPETFRQHFEVSLAAGGMTRRLAQPAFLIAPAPAALPNDAR